MSIKDFVVEINNSISLNESVVAALSDILLSNEQSVTIENKPVHSTSYSHSTEKSYLYGGRVPKPSDMFNGKSAASADPHVFPVISSFALGLTPDILGDNLSKKIKTLSSINDITKISLGTLASIVSEYSDLIERNTLKTKTKRWKTFKVGTYWPASYGLSFDAVNNVTNKKSIELVHNTKSNYAFIKLSPNVDCKFHIIQIDVDAITSDSIAAIFVLLDSHTAKDGDSFSFRVEYVSRSNATDQVRWPEILFFDAKYNANSIPLPGIAHTYFNNEEVFNGVIKIDGVDYLYVEGASLPEHVKSVNNIADTDRVFMSVVEANAKITNHFGEYAKIHTSKLKTSKYIGYGISGNEQLKLYTNMSTAITVECPLYVNNETNVRKVEKSRNLVADGSFTFNGIPDGSIFFGRPGSFFTPKKTGLYAFPTQYADNVEGIDGNVTKQYRYNDIVGPSDNGIFGVNSAKNKNGVVFEYDVDFSNVDGDAAIRLGHFDSILGLTLHYNGTEIAISHCGDGAIDATTNITAVDKVKCQLGFIEIMGMVCMSIVVRDATSILYSSPLVTVGSQSMCLLATRLLGESRMNSTVLGFVNQHNVFSTWSPVFTVLLDSIGESNLKLSNISVNHSLQKEEFFDKYIEFSKIELHSDDSKYVGYSSVVGISEPKIIKPSSIDGYICKVDSRSLNTFKYAVNGNPTFNAFRVDVTYSAYKGNVFIDQHVEYDTSNRVRPYEPVESTNSVVAIVDESRTLDVVNISDELTELTTHAMPNMTYGSRVVPDNTAVEHLYAGEQVDNVSALFGWKVSGMYQSIG